MTHKAPSFADDNLALAVLHSLVDGKLIAPPDWEAIRLANPYDRDLYWDEVFDGDVELEEIDDKEAYFQEACGYKRLNTDATCALVGLVDEHTSAVPLLRELRWWIPSDVIVTCWPQWDGESDEFDITTFDGIEACTALESIRIDLLGRNVDLRPLMQLPKLREVVVARLDGPCAIELATQGIVVKQR